MQPKGQKSCVEICRAKFARKRFVITSLACVAASSFLSTSPFSSPSTPPFTFLPPQLSPQPALAPAARRSAAAARPVAATALPPAVVGQLFSVAATLAEAKPGEVDAPFGAIALGAVVVTGASLLLAQGLRGGGDAAEKIFERDSKTGRRR